MGAGVSLHPLRAAELPDAVAIFQEAFFDNIRVVYGDNPKPDSMLDVWGFCREVEPHGFIGARDSAGKLVGYAFFTSSLKRLQRQAVSRGKPLVWTWRALTGRYGIVWKRLALLAANKLLFVGSARRFRTAGDAQLLNVAVLPSSRGQGVGRELMQAGLDYLRSRNVPEVRLEVRPSNVAAIKLYERTGFREVGRTRDRLGEWVVMTANP